MWCSGGSNQRGFITPGGVFHAPIHKGREVQDQVEAWLRSCSSRAKSMLGTCSISRSGKIAGLRTCSTAKSGTSKGSLASAQCQHEIMEVQDLPWSLEFATRKKLFVKVVYHLKNLHGARFAKELQLCREQGGKFDGLALRHLAGPFQKA